MRKYDDVVSVMCCAGRCRLVCTVSSLTSKELKDIMYAYIASFP